MSKRAQRVHDNRAYMLHATAWRETSLIVQSFSREHGCIALVAKGAKRPYSVLRPVLSAFQPLLMSWSGGGEVKTLIRAEVAGVHPLGGAALMSAWYMNELLLRLLPREDAHPLLFDAYETALQQLAGGTRAAGALRRFEWVLLRETGYGVDEREPDFSDPRIEPELRRELRERLEMHLVGRPLSTRRVLMDLQRL
ncbi:DNA repair protein RecO [Bordetella avium]|uniref:DNA repair protein RecO n=1 Tax=Bordetella avium (strain 197N) TaxID=360910 RepID=Q2KWX6_BORA1|nr:DNA repair protein RecO [Bordetella avium]AZY48628.1 DNA repair protein RecO [Bordetella avium]AZY52008.1 DNA repair protein RecO [Bordetella avium]RIQ13935.1 DNA repair protein RecO [Bordetella avium]RIQ16990.1 DNA repair protein RecO [Bordetella avium]RIQ36283.1 DNA repair protein RecO [Bordetella avium]